MPKSELAQITAIGNVTAAALEYGIPAIQRILAKVQTGDEPTVEDLEALGKDMKDPEDYFKKPDAQPAPGSEGDPV